MPDAALHAREAFAEPVTNTSKAHATPVDTIFMPMSRGRRARAYAC
jgi:hypothetical protein